jgi:chitinase
MYLLSLPYLTLFLLSLALAAFHPDSSSNIAIYWGQNSAGGVGGPHQERLSTYCTSPDIDIILISFLTAMNGADGQPQLNFANHGSSTGDSRCDGSTTPWTCPEIEADIKACQSKGKTVMLSLGGANSPETGYDDETSAKDGALRVWQMFGPPDISKPDIIRPFGSAVVDGFDFDFEHGVKNIVAFAHALRGFMNNHVERRFYLSAAPICALPNPIGPIQSLIDAVPLDMVLVQFYNNDPCDVRAGFNFEKWSEWAKDKGTVFLVGLPAKHQAAPAGGYVPPEQLGAVMKKAKGVERMGGVMLWDASQAWWNDEYHRKVKEALKVS